MQGMNGFGLPRWAVCAAAVMLLLQGCASGNLESTAAFAGPQPVVGSAGVDGGIRGTRALPIRAPVGGAWTTSTATLTTLPAPRRTRSARYRSAIEVGRGYRKLGKPYRIAGRLYVPKHNPNYDQTGVASWYDEGFHGKPTANGEIYDRDAMTAAHPTLPLPSLVRVTNLGNGRSVIVRVNDRGPFVKSRVIDLSKKAAETLGFASKGLARVRVQYVKEAALHGR